jgi:hypothetical protein
MAFSRKQDMSITRNNTDKKTGFKRKYSAMNSIFCVFRLARFVLSMKKNEAGKNEVL